MSTQDLSPVRADQRWREECIRYSICTIVTRPAEYAEMVESFKSGGFRAPDCEFLFLDNTQGNSFECYSGYNLFLNVARGEFVVLCHQDILLIDDGRPKLDAVLEDLTTRDPTWAACGNCGGEYPGRLALRITDPHGRDQRIGKFPVRVQSLDENFIVVRRSANLALSHDLAGFHLYGVDICVIADFLGCSCYVIDFHLRHKSPGKKDESFFSVRTRLVRKYRAAMRSQWIASTCTILFVSGFPGLGRLLSTATATRIARFVGRKAPWLGRIIFRS
jgi:hypothetical protein